MAHELEGILRGISADGAIDPAEIDRLRRWRDQNAGYVSIPPFSELASHVDRAVADGVLTKDECDDILFVATKLTTVNPHFSAIRAGVQILMGVLAGVSADRVVSDVEGRKLLDWCDEWRHLRGMWPYDECEAIVTYALSHPVEPEHLKFLLELSSQFPIAGELKQVDGESAPTLIGGICAVDPEIDFEGREFVITGDSAQASRSEIEEMVRNRAGIPHPRVRRTTNYLIVCDGGSPHWAFSCYGRKVEQAYELRREGHPIVIANEIDFWDRIAP